MWWSDRQLIITVKKVERMPQLLSALHKNHVRVSRLKRSANQASFSISHKHLPRLRRANYEAKCKITIHYAKQSVIRRDLFSFIGVLSVVFVPIILGQYIWLYTIETSSPELEDRIHAIIDQQLPVYKSDWQTDFELRQTIMTAERSLSWVQIERKGSVVVITPQLAPPTKKVKKNTVPSHLVAANGGIITHFHLTSGERIVAENMTVYKGDTLVSGVIYEGEVPHVVGAIGEVFADYWLETTFAFPRTLQVDVITGTKWQLAKNKQSSQVNHWAFWQNWKPIQTSIIEKKQRYIEESDVEILIQPLLYEKMLRSLPEKSVIKAQNILHVTFDDDTVKGKVLFLVNENIATPYPINRGE